MICCFLRYVAAEDTWFEKRLAEAIHQHIALVANQETVPGVVRAFRVVPATRVGTGMARHVWSAAMKHLLYGSLGYDSEAQFLFGSWKVSFCWGLL